MNGVIEAVSHFIRDSHLAALLLDALLKSFVILALAGGIRFDLAPGFGGGATFNLVFGCGKFAVSAVAFLPAAVVEQAALVGFHRSRLRAISFAALETHARPPNRQTPRLKPADACRRHPRRAAIKTAETSYSRRTSARGWLTLGFTVERRHFCWPG